MEQYCIASEVLLRCKENAQLMHSYSAGVSKGGSSVVPMQGAQLMYLGFMIAKGRRKKHFIYATLSN